MVRIKYRYLLIHILYPDPADSRANNPSKPSDKAVPDLLGLVSSSLSIKYLSPATSTAIIRCSRANYRLVWAALSFMTQVGKTARTGRSGSCAIQVVRVSGTIKKVEEEAIRRARDAILRAKRESGEESTDGVLGLLGGDEDEVLHAGVDVSARSDVEEEEDKMGSARIDSDEDG
ncbi:Rpp14/Pop5 family-domain-containing protein [Usnea florida]